MWKQFIREYLGFTRKERSGIFVLIALILICLLVPFSFSFFSHDANDEHLRFDKEIAELKFPVADSFSQKKHLIRTFDENNYTSEFERRDRNYYSKPRAAVFYFNPNTASVADWERLGIRDKTAETIQKFLSKGGHFYKPEDIGKIWGLHKDDIERLTPYVRIENEKREFTSESPPDRYPAPTHKKISSGSIEINTSDSTRLISLPGIGSKLAQRIIGFRNKLGGFYSIDQVGETYGLPDSTFQKIKPMLTLSSATIKKLNINSATLEELKSHPYIRYAIANALVQYRVQHGNYSSVEEIKKIMLISDDVYKKVSPYLTSRDDP